MMRSTEQETKRPQLEQVLWLRTFAMWRWNDAHPGRTICGQHPTGGENLQTKQSVWSGNKETDRKRRKTGFSLKNLLHIVLITQHKNLSEIILPRSIISSRINFFNARRLNCFLKNSASGFTVTTQAPNHSPLFRTRKLLECEQRNLSHVRPAPQQMGRYIQR